MYIHLHFQLLFLIFEFRSIFTLEFDEGKNYCLLFIYKRCNLIGFQYRQPSNEKKLYGYMFFSQNPVNFITLT